jgi:subtilisin family serine protease
MDLRSKEMSNERTVAAPLKYDAFWHLQAIGLLNPPDGSSPPPPPTQAREGSASAKRWESTLKGHVSKVAIIDTGVSTHPYLTGRLVPTGQKEDGRTAAVSSQSQNAADMNFNFDLSAPPTLLADAASEGKLTSKVDWEKVLKDWEFCPESGGKPWQLIVQNLVRDNVHKISFNTGAPLASNQKFSAHGTSCAGLIAASNLHYENSRSSSAPSSFDPPYYRGVDPDSMVMSITTSFAPRPDLLTLAFVLAAGNEADVILFPRGLPWEIGLADALLDPSKAAKLTDEQKRAAPSWQALKETILAVSRKIPVVCAAGNESEGRPIAPAHFAAEADNGIISVAAMSYFGYRSSYSNFGEGITVAAPSDDAEIFNRNQVRLDKTDRFVTDHPYDFFAKNLVKVDIPFGEATIRTIDVPGEFGFSDSSSNADAKLWTEPESFFTDFGGTSAAASIVAGVASLMQRAAKSKPDGARLTGLQIREILESTALFGKPRHLENLTNLPELNREDWVDEQEEKPESDRKPLSKEEKFGKGLVAADRAVNQILYGNPEGTTV